MIATAVSQDQIQLRLLKVFAEMITNTDKLDNASERINAVYNVLLVSVLGTFEIERITCKQFPGIHAFAKAE